MGKRELLVVRQVFETWWIAVPAGFDERWIADGSYWHAWDRRRSVSLSSTTILDEAGDPPAADDILASLAALTEGEPIADAPAGLLARAAFIRTDAGSRAPRALCGVAVVDGRVLTTTITSADRAWAIGIWRTIRYLPAAGAAGVLADSVGRRID